MNCSKQRVLRNKTNSMIHKRKQSKFKIIFFAKNTIKRMNRQATYATEIFANHIFNKTYPECIKCKRTLKTKQ